MRIQYKIKNVGGKRMQRNRETSAGMLKIAFASTLGATIEWYDFFLYGVMTALVFNKLFFPNYDPWVGVMLAYSTFMIGFVSRPVGGLIFGHFGDRLGRKNILVLTLLIMGLATVIIGLLPTYSSVGVWAPALLLLVRLLQGIGLGGEWGGAVLMTVEHAPKGRRAFYGSWPQMGAPAGLCLSSGAVLLFSQLPNDQFLAWGWRVPFLLSGLLVVIGIYIRFSIVETPEFIEMKEKRQDVAVPMFALFQRAKREVIIGLGVRYVEAACFNIFGVFIFAYVTTKLGLPRDAVLNGVIIACLIMIVMLPIYGILADRIGAIRVYAAGSLAIGICVFLSFWLLDNSGGNQAIVWLAIVIPFAFAYPAVYGPQAAVVSSLFSPEIRYTGISFVYQLSSIFFGGFTVIIATGLLEWGGGRPWLVCGYIAFAALVSFVAVQFAKAYVRDPSDNSLASLPLRTAEELK
jgi:MFS transporter, MHS family, shikimate and dehydroshikimate transport protein